MSHDSIKVTNIKVLDNPADFQDNFKFEITFESVEEMDKDLEWKLTYVGSVDSESYDQVLDSILVGPIPKGVSKFVFETPCADHEKLPKKDILGVTVIFLSCLFDDKEFIRIGYFINNEYDDPNAQYPETEKKPESNDIIEILPEEEDEDEEEVDEPSINAPEESTEQPKKKQKVDEEKKETQDIKTETKKKDETTTTDEEELRKKSSEEVPFPLNFDIKKVKRHIFADKPRITHIQI